MNISKIKKSIKIALPYSIIMTLFSMAVCYFLIPIPPNDFDLLSFAGIILATFAWATCSLAFFHLALYDLFNNNNE